MLRPDQQQALNRMQQLLDEMEQTKDLLRIRQLTMQLSREAKRLNADEPTPTPAGA